MKKILLLLIVVLSFSSCYIYEAPMTSRPHMYYGAPSYFYYPPRTIVISPRMQFNRPIERRDSRGVRRGH